MKNLLTTILLSVLLAGCGVNMYIANTNIPDTAPKAIIDLSASMDGYTDPVNIKHVETVGDFLQIDVSYSGGCEEHEFNLVSNGKFTPTYPVELEIHLEHNANGDRCRSLIDKRLFFDVTPFQNPSTSQVLFVVTNSNKTIDYSY